MSHLLRARSAASCLALAATFLVPTEGLAFQGGQLPGGEIDVSWNAISKGANYMVNTTLLRTSEFQFLSFDADPTSGIDGDPTHGTYQPEHVEAELAHLASLGVDGVRVWGSYYGWRIDNIDYIANLDDFAQRCVNHGIGIQYVFWSSTGNGMPALHSPTTLPLQGATLRAHINWIYDNVMPGLMGSVLSNDPCHQDEPWHFLWREEPEMDLFTVPLSTWPAGLLNDMRSYVGQVADTFNDHSGLTLCYDLFNEPEVTDVPDHEVTVPAAVDLMKETFDLIATKHDQAGSQLPFSAVDVTVGLTYVSWLKENMDAFLAAGIDLTVASFHSYGTTAQLTAAVTTAKQELRGFLRSHGLPDMPLVCSEFYDWGGVSPTPSVHGTLADQLAVLDQNSIEGYVWGVLASNALTVAHQYGDGLWRTDWNGVDLCMPQFDPAPIGTISDRAGFPDINDSAYTEFMNDRIAFITW